MLKVMFHDTAGGFFAEKPRISQFPDGTMHLSLCLCGLDASRPVKIVWMYENEAELLRLIYVTRHIQAHFDCSIVLFLPYLPNARMDREKFISDTLSPVFTLKYFCEIINSLGFRQVQILDVHSPVGAALLNRVCILSPDFYIQETRRQIKFNPETDCVFFPDEGSCKRYADLFTGCRHIAFGIKKRDFDTGKILGLEIAGEIPKNRRVLIVDDICSRGGTVYHAAKKLKALGAGEIYAYFTHCENTITEGELLKGDLLAGICTTNSICTLNPAQYPKLHILPCNAP